MSHLVMETVTGFEARTIVLRAIWEYVAYLLKHKWFVFCRGIRIGVPVWQLITHDLSKLLPREFRLNILRRLGVDVAENTRLSNFYHHRRNPHHWAYWVSYCGPEEMPERYILEMLADWQAAGDAKGGLSAVEWWERNKNRLHLHPKTRRKIENLLPLCRERWGI